VRQHGLLEAAVGGAAAQNERIDDRVASVDARQTSRYVS
jgi:hypothetical protein